MDSSTNEQIIVTTQGGGQKYKLEFPSLNNSVKLSISLGTLILVSISLFGVSNFLLNKKSFSDSKAANAISNSYDIVVAGAGTGGIGAAIQAARMGSKVLLLEETEYLGGQLAAGVTTIDVGINSWNWGLYREFENKMHNYYLAKKLSSRWPTCVTGVCFEPKGTKEVLNQMISSEPNITLLLRKSITSVIKQDNKITAVVLNSGETINTGVLIDATEYGDIIPLTGAGYRVGNGVKNNVPANACIQDITYTAVVKKYPNGVPQNLKINNPPPGYSPEIESMFKSVVQTPTTITKPITMYYKMKDTDQCYPTTSKYLNTFDCINNLKKYLAGKTTEICYISDSQCRYNMPTDWTAHNRYRGLPDISTTTPDLTNVNITKTDINWANDYDRENYFSPTHKLSAKYIEDKNYRKQINCLAKLRTIQFIYYMQHNSGMQNWSVSTDEGYNTPYNREENNCSNIPNELKEIEYNLPQIPYVRESRRGIGISTLTAKDIKRNSENSIPEKTFKSTIAIGTYPTDLHNCNEDVYLELNLETNADKSMSGPFQIPIETLISPEVKGLIFAEKNISQSRMVNGATRLQPTTMLIGQAAGALASLSVKSSTDPASIPVLKVQQSLLASNAVLVPFNDIISSSGGGQPYSTIYNLNQYSQAVQEIFLRGIASGYNATSFGPNDPLTRGQVAVFLVKAFNLDIKNYEGIFEDVPSSNIFAVYIESLARNGITSGCTPASQTKKPYFCPDRTLSNAEVAVFAVAGWSKIKPQLLDYVPSQNSYSDVPITHWAYKFIETLSANDIRWYCDKAANRFCLEGVVNRGVTSYIITSILNKN